VDDAVWLAELERLLWADPLSCVGEIGLDRAWVPPDNGGEHAWDDQVE
jgi:Tat protein secretion system quality control protein TatD with DNase activity